MHCPECQADHLVGFGRLVEVRNTERGPIALAVCPEGHLGHARTPAAQPASA